MSKFKTSRGKWEAGIVVNDDGEKWLGVVAGNRKVGERAITFLISREADINDEDIANATLIAAAPEMLDALIHQYRWVKSLYDLYQIDERAYPDSDLLKTERNLRELIERATGMTIDEAIEAYEAKHEQK